MITYPSPIEIGMIMLALQEYSNQQIAAALHIQETTVNNRFDSIFAKLNVKTRREAMLWYRRDYTTRALTRVDPSTYIPDSKETRIIDEATPLDEYMDTPLQLRHTKKRPDVTLPSAFWFLPDNIPES